MIENIEHFEKEFGLGRIGGTIQKAKGKKAGKL
jgi:hypothetical protein